LTRLRDAGRAFVRARRLLLASGGRRALAEACFEVGRTLGQMKRYALALATYRRAVDLVPGFRAARRPEPLGAPPAWRRCS